MNHEFWWIILGGCIGTYLLRYLPMRHAFRRHQSQAEMNGLTRFLIALGPSAITVLLVASLWPMLRDSGQWHNVIEISVAIVAIIRVKRRWGGIALPTFSGVGVFALVAYWLA
ncbi:AzlD domain-containing protein [Celerinatantimonas yamalensis]|uniref:AzlD domain-containing protein n=1 Tax=Celerinatantimonas yamalensis TaxID=559956 RepID=A0ABW9G5M7_9GAMM